MIDSAALFISLAHWNPHWQCFVKHPTCSAGATAALSTLLAQPLDFVNVVEFELDTYKPPTGWKAIALEQTCGHDWDTLFFDERKWKPISILSGCVTPSRSFASGTFQRKADNLTVAVVGAHFPQTLNRSTHAYTDAVGTLQKVFTQLGGTTGNAVLLADTNTEGPTAAAGQPSHHGVNRTNAQLMVDLGLWKAASAEPPAAPLYKGCCYNDNFSWQGDRIVSNFGTAVASEVLFDPAPEWAAFNTSEFHKGVRLVLQA